MKKYKCPLCGYETEGPVTENCPVCGTPASKFVETGTEERK